MTKSEAIASGYTVDDTTYPWVAYKGGRFNPSVLFYIYTPPFTPLENLPQEFPRKEDKKDNDRIDYLNNLYKEK
jgi:hypothetical protein